MLYIWRGHVKACRLFVCLYIYLRNYIIFVRVVILSSFHLSQFSSGTFKKKKNLREVLLTVNVN